MHADTYIRSFLVLCLQEIKTSVLLLRVLASVLYILWYFSFKQRWHFLVMGLKGGVRWIKSHLHFFSLSSHTCVFSLVLFFLVLSVEHVSIVAIPHVLESVCS